MSTVRKAVIPAAGFGTRMLPITKTISKEMLPLIDKPIIQVVIEELVEAGIEDIIIVTSAHKKDLADYFMNDDTKLINHLRASSPAKQALINSLEKIKSLAHITFVEQRGLYGTGTPVLNAEPYLNNEPFIYTFADDFFVSKRNSYLQMLDAFERYNAPVAGSQRRTNDEDYIRYGYFGGTELQPGEIDVTTIVEHPGKENKPGDLASFGGFIVTPEVLGYLHKAEQAIPEGKEFYFHAALSLMIADGKRVVAKEITDAHYYDTGNKLEYMKTVVSMATTHPEIGEQFEQFLIQFVKEMSHES